MTFPAMLVGGALYALGYHVGAGGEKKLIVCPCGPDGKPDLPALPVGTAVPLPNQAVSVGRTLMPIIETLTASGFRPVGTNTTQGIGKMLDAVGADKIVVYIVSTLDQAVTIQLVGSYIDSPGNTQHLIALGSSFSQGIGSTAQSVNSIELVLDEVWHPYIGITVLTGGTAPTVGTLQVLARGQRWIWPAPAQRA